MIETGQCDAAIVGGRLDLVADFGDRTVRLPVSDTADTTAP